MTSIGDRSRVIPSGPLAFMRDMKKRFPRLRRWNCCFCRGENFEPALTSGMALPDESKNTVSKLSTVKGVSSRPSSMAASSPGDAKSIQEGFAATIVLGSSRFVAVRDKRGRVGQAAYSECGIGHVHRPSVHSGGNGYYRVLPDGARTSHPFVALPRKCAVGHSGADVGCGYSGHGYAHRVVDACV